MARFLAYTSPARGHLYPIIPTLLELGRRGHDVQVRTLSSEVTPHGGRPPRGRHRPGDRAIELTDWQSTEPSEGIVRIFGAFASGPATRSRTCGGRSPTPGRTA